MRDDFARLCKHAERFGTGMVYETAEAADLELVPYPLPLHARDLGYLARRLRKINPKWSLDLTQRRRLFDRLVGIGQSDKEIALSCGVNIQTARTWRNEASNPLNHAAKSEGN